MEKISCKKCGGDLIEMNGIFYCWSCDAKYALINGEPRLLKCKICGGDVVDCGDHYECELCGQRYKKPAPEPEPVPAVPEETKKTEKEPSAWEKVFCKGYNSAFAARTPEEATAAIAVLEECYPKAVELIQKIEDDTEYVEACNEICAKFFGAVKFLAYNSFMKDNSSEIFRIQTAAKKDIKTAKDMEENIKLHTRVLELIKEDMENDKVRHKRREKLSKLSSGFLVSILEISGDHVFVKMVAERAVEIFTGSNNKEVKEHHCPEIMGVVYGCDEGMEKSQEELTAAYWKIHPGKYEKLSAKKTELEKEREEIEAEEDKFVEEEKRKTEAIRKEIEAAEKKWDAARDRSKRLNFFQKKEKKRLEEEMFGLTVQKNNLKEKLKLREKEEEKNIDKITMKYSKIDVDVTDRIFDIEEELERNHYPDEDDFVRLFSSEIKKVIEISEK